MCIAERKRMGSHNQKNSQHIVKKSGRHPVSKGLLLAFLVMAWPLFVVAESPPNTESVTSDATIQVTQLKATVIDQVKDGLLPQTNSVGSFDLVVFGLLTIGLTVVFKYKMKQKKGENV